MQIIKRDINSCVETVNQNDNAQIAINSDGRLSVRYKHNYDGTKDTLIMFDTETSKKMIRFCQQIKTQKDSNLIYEDEIPY